MKTLAPKAPSRGLPAVPRRGLAWRRCPCGCVYHAAAVVLVDDACQAPCGHAAELSSPRPETEAGRQVRREDVWQAVHAVQAQLTRTSPERLSGPAFSLDALLSFTPRTPSGAALALLGLAWGREEAAA